MKLTLKFTTLSVYTAELKLLRGDCVSVSDSAICYILAWILCRIWHRHCALIHLVPSIWYCFSSVNVDQMQLNVYLIYSYIMLYIFYFIYSFIHHFMFFLETHFRTKHTTNYCETKFKIRNKATLREIVILKDIVLIMNWTVKLLGHIVRYKVVNAKLICSYKK